MHKLATQYKILQVTETGYSYQAYHLAKYVGLSDLVAILHKWRYKIGNDETKEN